MENPVTTPATDKTPEQIEHEMLQTRESMTEKVAALEHQLVGTVQNAADTLTGTVDAVKSLVSHAPETVSDTFKQAAEAVSETVKKTFDVSGHVRAHPWTAVGTSAALGFLTGLLVFRGRQSGFPTALTPAPTFTPHPAAAAAPAGPGLFDDLLGMLGRKVKEVTESVINTASASIDKNVREGVPKLIDAAKEHLTPGSGSSPEAGFDGAHRIFRG